MSLEYELHGETAQKSYIHMYRASNFDQH